MSAVFWLAYILGWILRPFPKKPRQAAVVPPANPGSLGDEAMMQSAILHLESKGYDVSILVLATSDDWSPVAPRAKKIGPINDSRAAFFARWKKSIVSAWALIRSNEVICIGADLMDGNYDKETSFSLKLLLMLNGLAGAGCDVRIAGFSFNNRPLSWSVAGLRVLMGHAKLFSRDPRSFARLKERGIERITLVADLAFLLEPRKGPLLSTHDDKRIEEARRSGVPVIGVNPFFKYENETDLERKVAGLTRLVSGLLALNTRPLVVFVSHDVRVVRSMNEYEFEKRTLERLTPAELERVFHCHVKDGSAAAVRELSGRFTAAFSGRMHFTITCTTQCTPTLSLVYQDKFEGLFEHLGLDPAKFLFQQNILADDPDAILERFRWLLSPDVQEQTRKHLAEVLPKMETLARLNFS